MSCVDAVLQDLGDNDGRYNTRRIMKAAPDCPLWLITGARRIGKTDLMLHAALKLWLEYGRQTIWMRDRLVTIQEKSFQQDFLNDAYDLGWISGEWKVDSKGVQDPDGNTAIKFMAISGYSSRRGPAHPDVDLIVLDEFIPEDRCYLKGCLKGLLSITKTVFSGRSGTRCILLSNFVSLSNPYFAGLDIYPQDDISVWDEKGVAVEVCRGYRCAIAKDSPWNNLYKAGRYGDYEDQNEDRMGELIKKMPKGSKPDSWAVYLDGFFYRLYHSSKGMIYWAKEKSEPYCTIYAADPRDLREGVQLLPDLYRMRLEEMLRGNTVRFPDANSLFAMVNLVYNI